MKITKTFAAILIAGTMLLSGCSEENDLEKPDSFTEASDPMKETSGSQSNSTPQGNFSKGVLGSYSHNFKSTDVDFSTDTLVLTPSVIGDGNPTILGAMAFIDGIPRKFTENGSSEKKTLSVVETTPSEVEYILELDTEFDAGLDTHYATMLYILDPSFKPEKGNSFGVYHSESHWYSQPINTTGKELPKMDVKALKKESIPLTQKQMEKYNIKTDGAAAARFLLNDKKEKYQINLTDGHYPELTFAAYTQSQRESGKYRVTFYKNHKLCKFNSGYDCLDVTLEADKIVEEEIVFDEELHAGDFVYCVAIPLFEGGLTEKDSSKMVFDENGETSQTSQMPQSSQNPQPASSSAINENSEPSPAVQPNSSEKINAINLRPKFTNSDTIYFIDNRDRNKLSLISSKNGSDIQNTLPLENYNGASIHGDYVSVLFENNGRYIAKLYDKDFKEIKSADLSELQISYGISPQGMMDFDKERIVYIAREGSNAALFSCDWNFENKQKLMEVPNMEHPFSGSFQGISLSKDFVAFTIYVRDGSNTAGYYGVCDFNGNYKINRKDGIDTPQTNDTTAMWQDDHTNINAGEMPSGKIEIYKDGKFTTLTTEEITESHRAFLCNSEAIITATESGNWCLRKYSDGKVSQKIDLREEMYIASAVEFKGKIYARVSGESTSNCLVWEEK